MRTLKAEFTLASPSDDIVINSYEINVFPRSYSFSNFLFTDNTRFKIFDSSSFCSQDDAVPLIQ